MSNYVAIDTSSRYLTVLAVKGDKSVCRYDGQCALNHSVKLMDVLDDAMTEAELTPNECDFFAAVVGPGSFTGIRIGIATAKGLALATGKRLLSVTSFDLIAYNTEDDDFVAVADAAHDHYYICRYTHGVAGEACYVSREEVEAYRLPLYGFEELNLPAYRKVSVVQGLERAVAAKQSEAGDGMQALYIRKSQAEEGRK